MLLGPMAVPPNTNFGKLVVFTLFLLIIILPFPLLFLSAQILSGQVLSNHWTICPEIWGYGWYGCELCKRVSKFKMSDSKASPWACPKPLKLCLNYISLTLEGIVLNFFFDMINILIIHRAADRSVYSKNSFVTFSTKTYVVGTQKYFF